MTTERDAAIEAAKKSGREKASELLGFGLSNQDKAQADAIVEAAILAYEQHRGKQEPVGYEVNFRTFGEGWVGWHRPGPEFTREHYQKKAKTQPDRYLYRDLYASPQPADVGALREKTWIEWAGGECPVPEYEVVEVKFLSGGTTEIQANKHRWDRVGKWDDIVAYHRRDLATSGGGE